MAVFQKRRSPGFTKKRERSRPFWHTRSFTKNFFSAESSPPVQRSSFPKPIAILGLAVSLVFFFAVVMLVSPSIVEPFAYLPLIIAIFLVIFFVSVLITKHPRRAFLLAYSGALLVLFQLRNMFHWYVMMLILPLLFIEVILTKMKKE